MLRSVRLWSWLLLACLINQNFVVFAADRDRLQQLLHRFPEADLNQDGQLSFKKPKLSVIVNGERRLSRRIVKGLFKRAA
jgi:hypothetical protein